jgi:hypothetical protein
MSGLGASASCCQAGATMYPLRREAPRRSHVTDAERSSVRDVASVVRLYGWRPKSCAAIGSKQEVPSVAATNDANFLHRAAFVDA